MLIEIGLLILAIPVGLLIAYLTKDELKQGRFWFRIICDVSLVLAALFLILKVNYLAWTFLFVFVSTGVSIWKAHAIRGKK
jgi:ABC-type Fe3+ transport system permease subunit